MRKTAAAGRLVLPGVEYVYTVDGKILRKLYGCDKDYVVVATEIGRRQWEEYRMRLAHYYGARGVR